MRVLTIVMIAAALAATTTVANATDHPIAGTELRIKRGANDVERLVFSSRGALILPTPGSSDDPVSGTPGGATIELFSPGYVPTVSYKAPRATTDPGWRPGSRRYRFGHTGAPDGVSAIASIRLHSTGGMRVVGKRAGLALDYERSVAIRITMGETRYCALFGPATVKRDEHDVFRAAGAPASALADCSDGSLAPPPPPTATPPPIPTPTPGVCGDGVIDPGTENCDGAALGTCGEYGFSCGSPGFSNECTCCSDGPQGDNVTMFGCCDSSAILLGTPAGGGWCFSQRCDAPFTCGGSAECLPSGDCCGKQGNPCLFTITGQPLVPCCDGFECSRPDLDGIFLTCCASQGSACSQDQECCSASCSESGSCD